MKMDQLGSLAVTAVGLGCNQFGNRCDAAQSAKVVHAALDSGINFFDTADVYGSGLSEEYLGKALGRDRDEVVIASKFGHQFGDSPEDKGGSERWISKAVEASLRRLGTDRIDLYQMHLPDPEVPIDKTLEALTRLIKDGKVIEIGCSNFSGEQIEEAERVSSDRGYARFVSAQNHFSLLTREPEKDVVPVCESRGLGLLPYFPLESGMLTGKYRRDEEAPEGTRLSTVPQDRRSRFMNDRAFDVVERLEELASGWGIGLLDIAIGWLAAQKSVASVIAGATKPEQVRANVKAALWVPGSEELAAIDEATSR